MYRDFVFIFSFLACLYSVFPAMFLLVLSAMFPLSLSWPFYIFFLHCKFILRPFLACLCSVFPGMFMFCLSWHVYLAFADMFIFVLSWHVYICCLSWHVYILSFLTCLYLVFRGKFIWSFLLTCLCSYFPGMLIFCLS